jgi:prevent-host-death family protein
MKKIPAGEFKAKCLDLLDKVKERREEYVITKRGVPFAKLTPVEPHAFRSALGVMRGTVLDSSQLDEPNDEPWGESESDPLNQLDTDK